MPSWFRMTECYEIPRQGSRGGATLVLPTLSRPAHARIEGPMDGQEASEERIWSR